MRRYIQEFRDFFRKGDMVLLLLCLVTTAFGCLILASATNPLGNVRYLVIQIGAAALGVLAFAIFSSIDIDFFSEHRNALVIFNAVLLLMLIPFGTDNGTGNRSWLDFPFLPVNIQPAEICKITFVMILASVMSSHQNKISSVKSVLHMALHLIILMGMNMVLSDDAGVSLIFVFIFIGMAITGGVSLIWFLIAGGALVAAFPIVWNVIMDNYQRLRFEVLLNPELDALGTGPRYQTMRAMRSLTGGGLTGQGLFQGTRTQTRGALVAQHTDFVFSAVGEELGYVGCAIVLILLFLIVFRCIQVGTRSQDYMRRLICFGTAAALTFQILVNVGMNLELVPVIGLTLPFISYGGSSLVTLFAMLGLVSGVHARPAPTSHERYIRPPLKSYQ